MTQSQLQNLIKQFAVPKHIQAHSQKVTQVALFLGQKLKAKGEKIDLDLVEKAALLHDILRVCDMRNWQPEKFPEKLTKRKLELWNKLRQKYHGRHHADATYQMLKAQGFPKIATVIKKHKFIYLLDPVNAPKTWEEKLVYYADKRVKHAEIVSLKERIRDGKLRNVRGQEALKISARAEKKVYELEKEIFAKIGADPGIIPNNLKVKTQSSKLKT